ncbi:SNARE complex subunit (Vam7) [Penicillium brevicompactum]|uniref:SNARE complex subunit (Vam7) n=1 Tax=Penicillium brevicompactum TaxID=5074 RepID=A0A9W9R292_PENBR|nr:SNARE complex subunit (Vam7) [Penicillium brevicompactum]
MNSQRSPFLTKLAVASIATLTVLFFVLFFHPARTATLPQHVAPAQTSGNELAETPTAIKSIPNKIWYKVGPKGLSSQSQEWMDDCLHKNPEYRSEIMTDLSGDLYVKNKISHRPDIVETYLALSIPILKADLLRYLLLFAEGGIWYDLDVSCGDVPIRQWIPEQFKANTNLVVGLEFDEGWGEHILRQFTSWTIMAAPHSPHMMMVIEDILDAIRQKSDEKGIAVSELSLEMVGDVVDFTGPRRLTRGILKSLALTLDETVDMNNVSHLLDPVLISDVLVLPGYSFAASANRYVNQTGPALVTHHYAGSWKNDNGGETS